jgi:hypothetical protein
MLSFRWSMDPVHPSKHIYAKTALHLLEKIAPAPDKTPKNVNPGSQPPGRKRTGSDSNRSDSGTSSGTQRFGGGSGSGGGHGGGSLGSGGGYPTPRSQHWKERRDSEPRGGGGGQRYFDRHSWSRAMAAVTMASKEETARAGSDTPTGGMATVAAAAAADMVADMADTAAVTLPATAAALGAGVAVAAVAVATKRQCPMRPPDWMQDCAI